MNFTLKRRESTGLGNYQFINWKKAARWTCTIGSAGIGIAALLTSTPLGWAALGFGAIFGLISWLCDSREDKLRKGSTELSTKVQM